MEKRGIKMKYVILLIVALSAYGMPILDNTLPNNNEKCVIAYNSFIRKADSDNCYDLKYSLLSFKQLILNDCLLEHNDIIIADYVNTRVKKNICK